MKILVSDIVRKKLERRKMPENAKLSAKKIINQLYQFSQKAELDEFWKKHNGKKLKGTKDNHIFKLRLSDGYRLVYTYGKYLSGIREENSFVILDCIEHEEQDLFKELPVLDNYIQIKELQEIEIEDMTEENLRELISDYSDVEAYQKKFLDTHTMYVYDNRLDIQKEFDEFDVYLSEEQINFITNYFDDRRPMYINGGAGSGKTIMAIHILYNFQCVNQGAKCAYFTQSQELLELAKRKYNVISTDIFGGEKREQNTGTLEFFDINEYCLQHLNLTWSNLVRYDQFKEEFVEKQNDSFDQLKQENISIFSLWAEIRGSIKGALDSHWHRVDTFDQHDWNGKIIANLDKEKLIIRQEKDKRKFYLSQKALNGEYKLTDKKTLDALNKMREISNNVNPNLCMMAKEDYNKVSEENTTLEKEKRDFLYWFCQEKYQPWLNDMKYYDENDLICNMLKKGIDETEQYDFIVIDEIQDYTELQIYFISLLAKQKNCLIMAGDSHQIVNPTMFKESKLKQLFGQTFYPCHLSKNFRCQDKIVDYTNVIAQLRNNFIGKDKELGEECSVHKGVTPLVMENSKENMRNLITKLLDYPNAVILVPDEAVKENLINFFENDTYNTNKRNAGICRHIIYTVAEVKGMEYRSIFCYNLISYYFEIWSQILDKVTAKKKTKYRYYFNLLYVGVSRAQEYLCFIEEKEHSENFYNEIRKKLPYDLQILNQFDENRLHFNDLSNNAEDWLAQAEMYKRQGNYEDAIYSLERAEASEEKIIDCKMHLCIKKQKFSEAMKYALYLNNKEIARKYYKELDKNTNLSLLIQLWLKPATTLKERKIQENTITDTIEECFSNWNIDWQEKIRRQYIKFLGDYMLKKIKSRKETGEKI